MPINLFINGSDIREMNLGNHQQNQNIGGQNYYGENDDKKINTVKKQLKLKQKEKLIARRKIFKKK